MLSNLFKKKGGITAVETAPTLLDEGHNGPVTVEQIHNEFDTAPERLLRVANEIIGNKGHVKQTHQQILESYKKFESLGFTNTPTAKKLKQGIDELSVEAKGLSLVEQEVEDILYYKRTYPFLKFLTEKELDRICNKYGLSYAPVDRYIKEVPEKNLQEVLGAQELKFDDKAHDIAKVNYFSSVSLSSSVREFKETFPDGLVPLRPGLKRGNFKLCYNGVSYFFFRIYNSNGMEVDTLHVSEYEVVGRTGLFIAAPKEEFDLTGLEEKGLGFFPSKKVEIKDPVVFRYVRGGVQVLSKWGPEAMDPALQVDILN